MRIGASSAKTATEDMERSARAMLRLAKAQPNWPGSEHAGMGFECAHPTPADIFAGN